jgi:CheY-like chemotaxis protein
MCKTFARLTRTEPSQPVNRRFQRLAATTLVAITGHADDAGRKAALEKRFDVHVPKPGNASKLERFLIRLGADDQGLQTSARPATKK